MRTIVALALAAATIALCTGLSGSAPQPMTKQTKITYAEHVAPILNKHCVECHRPGEVAPFSLIGYEEARKRAPMLAAVTGSKQMPPWKAEHGFGEFLDENRLTSEQIKVLRAWSEAGAPRGDAKKEPRPPTFKTDWALGEPDMIVQPAKPFELGAEGDDVYRNFVIKTNFPETKWVRAIDVRPGNPKVVHHVIAFIDEQGRAAKIQERTSDGQEGYGSWGGGVGFMPDGSFGGWAPGVRPRSTAGDVAFELKPGATIVLQVHYHKSGKPETDQTKVGLYFSPKPKKVLHLAWLANPLFRLKPGEKDQKVDLRIQVPTNLTLYGVMPHMHQLGTSMKAQLELADGTKKPLIWIKDWDFNWQLTYAFKQPVKAPKGSNIYIEALYDNSAENPRNPHDPPKLVTWGEQTSDEMFLLVAAYTTDDGGAFNDREAIMKALFGRSRP